MLDQSLDNKGDNLMTYVASILGLMGLVMAWVANRRSNDLTEQMNRVNSRIYYLRREMEVAQEKAEQEKMTLKYELLQLKGELKISPAMTIGELVRAHPQAQQLLAGFHIGGCSSCSVDERQTLGDAVTMNGREIEPILVALNNLITESATNGRVAEERLKTPNVQLQI